MSKYSIILGILALMMGLSAISKRIKLPYPVLLIAGGIIFGFIPHLPEVQVDPEIIFLIFLPPLLYDAAFNISFGEFRNNMNTISTLAISLVFLSASAIALTARYMIPGMTWPLAFVLGSILSATDAVAAISVIKGLGLSKKTVTILEGESLVNDASALVAYRFAVATVAGSAFILWKAGLQFLFLMAGGALVGIVMGKVLAFILARVREDNLICISFMLLMPFITYLFAEDLHVSGVISVVILGLSIARFGNKIFPESLKQQSKSIWDILIFLLNGLIFILIGLELPYVLHTLEKDKLVPYIIYSLVITLVAFLVRMARVFLQQRNLLDAFRKKKHRVTESMLLDFKSSLVISWSGMRGIVSLATAIALPVTLSDGTAFPLRDAIIFITVMVVLFTIVLQGTTLPWVIRKLK